MEILLKGKKALIGGASRVLGKQLQCNYPNEVQKWLRWALQSTIFLLIF